MIPCRENKELVSDLTGKICNKKAKNGDKMFLHPALCGEKSENTG